MQAKDLTNLSATELKQKLGETRDELFRLRFRHATSQLENTASIPQVRKNIARILTVMQEKERGA